MLNAGMVKNRMKIMKGFSLLEMIVAISIFMIVVTSIIEIYSRFYIANKNAIAIANSSENARTTIEEVAKIVRMSSKNWTWGYGDQITMYNASLGQCISFRFKNNHVESCKCNPYKDSLGTYDCRGSDACDDGGAASGYKESCFQPISSSVIEDAKFVMMPSLSSISRITIMLKTGGKSFQTTISIRDYSSLQYEK